MRTDVRIFKGVRYTEDGELIHMSTYRVQSYQPQGESVMEKIAPYWKAVVAFLAPALVALGAAMQDGSPGGSTITSAEWVGIAVAAVATGGLVFGVPNKDPSATHQDESVQPPQA